MNCIGRRGESRCGCNIGREKKKLSRIGGVLGLFTAIFIPIFFACTPSEQQNNFDNGSTGNPTGTWTQQVRETPISVSLRNNGAETTPVQNTKLYKQNGIWRINLEWRPEYQNRARDLDVQIRGNAPTELMDADTLADIKIMIQGYHKYDANPKCENDPVSITHNGKGWVELDELGELLNVMITEMDIRGTILAFERDMRNNNQFNGLIVIDAVADTLNGARVILGNDYPERDIDTGDTGRPFVPNMDDWRAMNNPASIPMFEGVFNQATGQYEYDYTKEPLTGELFINASASGNEVKNGDKMMIRLSNGKFTLIDIPEAGQEHGKGDDISYYPFFTDKNGNTSLYTDDFNAIPEPRHTGEKAVRLGNFSFAPYALKGDAMSTRNSYYESEFARHRFDIRPIPNERLDLRFVRNENGTRDSVRYSFAEINTLDGKKPAESTKQIGEIFDVWVGNGGAFRGVKIDNIPVVQRNLFRLNVDGNLLQSELDNPTGARVFYDSIPNIDGMGGYQVLELKVPTNEL